MPRLDLVPREGMILVGLEGEIASGCVARIGVLECARDHRYVNVAPLSFMKRLPWYGQMFAYINDEYEAYPYHDGTWTSSALERPVPNMVPALLARREGKIDNTLTSVAADIDLRSLDFYDSHTFSPETRPTDGIDTRKDWFAIESSKGERIVGIEVDITELPSALRVSHLSICPITRNQSSVLTCRADCDQSWQTTLVRRSSNRCKEVSLSSESRARVCRFVSLSWILREGMWQLANLAKPVHSSSSGGGALVTTLKAHVARVSASGPLLVYNLDDTKKWQR